MIYTVTATFSTRQEAAAFLAGAASPTTPLPTIPTAETKALEAVVEKVEAPAEQAKHIVAKKATPKVEPTPAAEPEKAAATPFAYATLQKDVVKLCAMLQKKGIAPESVTDISKAHGGATFKQVPEAQWPAAHADVLTKIAEVEAMQVEVA